MQQRTPEAVSGVRRVRDEARDGLAVMAVSGGLSLAVTLVITLLVGLGR